MKVTVLVVNENEVGCFSMFLQVESKQILSF